MSFNPKLHAFCAYLDYLGRVWGRAVFDALLLVGSAIIVGACIMVAVLR